MASSWMFARGRRVAAAVSLVVIAALAIPLATALAAVTVSKAELDSGDLVVEGTGARSGATITVTSPESTATGRAGTDGKFRVRASGFTSSTCQATVSDGSTSTAVTLSRCTPTSAPPPAGSPTITPDVPELGPGYVGSDFVTFSSTTTTMTFGPDTLGPVRFEIIAGALPDGLSLVDPNAGFTPAKSVHASVSGVPTTIQTSTFTIRATDANGLQATRTYTIVINAPRTLEITPQPWAPVRVGEFANLWMDGSGGVRPYRWAVTAGQLPPGMSLIQDNPDGPLVRVGGTPTTAGTFEFTLRLTDAQGATVSRTFAVTVQPATEAEPVPAGLAALAVSPTSVTGGTSSTGTVSLDAAAPSGGASVTLSSSSAAATVPASVTVPAGATSATFTVSTAAVSASTSATISATYAGVTRTATLSVNAPASSADTVSISRAEYDSGKRVLRVEATSSGSGATLRAHVTATNELIGTLSGGRGEFAWPSNPQQITVRSSLGGSATRTVTVK